MRFSNLKKAGVFGNNSDRGTPRNRGLMIRLGVAVILWAMVIFCFVVCIHVTAVSNAVVSEIRGNVVTPEQMMLEDRVCAAAECFAREYLSFNGDQDDYRSRLSSYGSFSAPAGEQSVLACGLSSIEQSGNIWHINLEVLIDRYVTECSNSTTIPLKRIVRQYEREGRQMVVYTKQERENYQVSIRVGEDYSVTIIGTPVLMASRPVEYIEPADMLANNPYPEDFAVFVSQVAAMYFKGEDLSNYLDNGVYIVPAGNYSVDNITITRYEPGEEKATALLHLELLNGDMRLPMDLVLEARMVNERWLLLRIGGY